MPSPSRQKSWPHRGAYLDVAWVAFSLVNLAAILRFPEWETVPFHLIWVSLTIVYGFRVWSPPATWSVLLIVCLTTGVLISRDVSAGEEPRELAEVPLMAAMFVAMVWHARRRRAAMRSLEELSRTNLHMLEQQRQFVANASHELRTPITIALGHAELVAHSVRPAAVADDAQVVLEELDRLRRLSDRMLALAASEGPSDSSREMIDVGAIVSEVAARWMPTDRAWSVAAADRAQVLADRDRLVLALDALIDNAVINTDPGDSIRLAMRTVDGFVELQVSDTGRGIAAADLERIFERFTHLDASSSRGGAGRGLGLSIVRAVAESHGGRVTVSSRPGQGACFTIALPVAATRAPADNRARHQRRPSGGTSAQPRRTSRVGD